VSAGGGGEPSPGALVACLGLVIPLVALGWQAGEKGFEHGRAERGAVQVVSTATGIDFHIPSGWGGTTPSVSVRQLGFTLVRAYASGGQPALGDLVIGLGDGEGPALLSGRSLAALHTQTKAARVKELQSNAFVRVVGTLAGQHGKEATIVYSQPATPHNIEVVCVAGVGRTGSPETNACRLVASTLELTSSYGQAIRLNRLAGNPARVHAALAQCYGEAKKLREALWRTADRDEQARQAGRLAALYELAARQLAHLGGDPVAAPAQDALGNALRHVASGYVLLERGALRGDGHDWAAGRRRVLAGEPQMNRAVREVLAP
jgi:hypothetical protein